MPFSDGNIVYPLSENISVHDIFDAHWRRVGCRLQSVIHFAGLSLPWMAGCILPTGPLLDVVAKALEGVTWEGW